jgi:nucleotide-binding universal stress UspA family protein
MAPAARTRQSTPREAASFHDLLVYFDESKAAANALAYAEALTPDENVTALMFGYKAEYPFSYYSEVPVDAWVVVQQQAEAEAAAVEARCRAHLVSTGSRAELRRANIMSGQESNALATQARYADAAVIGWPAKGSDELRGALFEGALFHSGRPVVLVPETAGQRGAPKNILIAWSAEAEATRAVHEAMHLLRAADQVRILVVNSGGSLPEKNPGDDIARHLARHDVKVEVKLVPAGGGAIHAVLLEEARYFAADLLVMGGYGHSRTGEWFFGGTTRDILDAATLPVLMSH